MPIGLDSGNPLSYDLEVLTIVNNEGDGFDIKNIFIECNIYESIHRNFLLGEVVVSDQVAFLENAKLFGQESIRIKFNQPSGNQDKTDDEVIGVKSSALALADKTKPFIYITYGLTILGLLLIGWINLFEIPFFVFCSIAFTQLIWQIYTVNLDEPSDCLKKFKSNRLFGSLITIAIFSG